MEYYAHIREREDGSREYQTVAQHLLGTAELCREFAAAFGAGADGWREKAMISENAQRSSRIGC